MIVLVHTTENEKKRRLKKVGLQGEPFAEKIYRIFTSAKGQSIMFLILFLILILWTDTGLTGEKALILATTTSVEN